MLLLEVMDYIEKEFNLSENKWERVIRETTNYNPLFAEKSFSIDI